MKKIVLALTAVMLIAAFAFAGCANPGTDVAVPGDVIPTEQPSEPTGATGGEQATEAAATEQTALTVTVMGEITEIDKENETIHIVGEENTGAVSDVIANIGDDTVLIDAQTEREIDFDALKQGEKVQVTLSTAMTRSVPPQANAYAVVVNLPENGMGIPTYIVAKEVTALEDGSIEILNQNADVIVTIPADLKITVLDENETVPATDVKNGSVLMAWYDIVSLSYPGQATATQAVIVKD